MQVGVNWTSLGRGIQVRLGAPRRFPASKWRHPPNGHRPDLTLQRQVQTDQAESHLRGGGERGRRLYDLGHLKLGVMYYCLENTTKQMFDCYRSTFQVSERNAGNWPPHPRADVFYLTGSDGNGPGGSTGLTLVWISRARLVQRRGSEAALPIGSRRKRTPSTSCTAAMNRSWCAEWSWLPLTRGTTRRLPRGEAWM